METIRVSSAGLVTTVALARPSVRNAFNAAVIAEVTEAFRAVPERARVVVLRGEGPAFCAGADVEWMRKSRDCSEEQNARDAAAMAAMFRAVDECPKPVVGRIHSFALGGGTGLAACCDIVVASEDAQFGFTEVRLGIMPGIISSFVLPKIGASAARRLFLTGERFGAEEGRRIGLVHEVAKADALDARVDAVVKELLAAGPKAAVEAKRLIRDLLGRPRDEAVPETVRRIARLRVTPEAQEGLGAFLEKRKPNWA